MILVGIQLWGGVSYMIHLHPLVSLLNLIIFLLSMFLIVLDKRGQVGDQAYDAGSSAPMNYATNLTYHLVRTSPTRPNQLEQDHLATLAFNQDSDLIDSDDDDDYE